MSFNLSISSLFRKTEIPCEVSVDDIEKTLTDITANYSLADVNKYKKFSFRATSLDYDTKIRFIYDRVHKKLGCDLKSRLEELHVASFDDYTRIQRRIGLLVKDIRDKVENQKIDNVSKAVLKTKKVAEKTQKEKEFEEARKYWNKY